MLFLCVSIFVDITVACVVGLCMLLRVTVRAYRLAVMITVVPLCCLVVSGHATRLLSVCVPSLSGHHCCMRCVAMDGVSCHCSSLPPCSEMMFQQVTLIDTSFCDHTSHAVCASISTRMCVAIQFCNFWPAAFPPRWRTTTSSRSCHGSERWRRCWRQIG